MHFVALKHTFREHWYVSNYATTNKHGSSLYMISTLYISNPLVTDPTWIFFLVLMVILCAPILLRRLHIPHIIGLILAGIVLGQYGLNILERDNSFELFGQVGIYFIMFLAALELDMGSVMRYGRAGLRFGVLTFVIPFVLGTLSSRLLLDYAWPTCLMLGSLFSSHTLVAYPIVGRYGMGKHRTVVISVVATAFTTFLSLLALALVVGSQTPNADGLYWVLFAVKCAVYGFIIIFFYPRIGRWFLRKYDDPVAQFIFVLSLVFLSAALAELAGLEGILGAFLAGLAVNRLIPHTSPLMNRLEFVGNALFIPYFLIGVGMIINVRVLLSDFSTIKVVGVVVATAILTKWIAAWVMNIGKNGSPASRTLMFGLSNAHAAGALAIVMIGTTPEVNLMDSSILNAVVMLILFSCIVSSFATNRGALKLALSDTELQENRGSYHGKCLITYDHQETVDVLTQLAIMIRNPFVPDSLMGLSVTFDNESEGNKSTDSKVLRRDKRNLEQATRIAAAADVAMTTLSRVSTNVASGILHTMKEYNVGEVVLGMHLVHVHHKESIADGNEATQPTDAEDTATLRPGMSLGNVVDGVIEGSHREIMVVHLIVPPGTLRHLHVVIPQKAEYEVGFYKWLEHICRLGEQLDCHLCFHAFEETTTYIRDYMGEKHQNVRTEFTVMSNWKELLELSSTLGRNDMLIVVTSRPGFISYTPEQSLLPQQMSQNFKRSSLMLLYPDQWGDPSETLSVFSPNGMAVTKGMSTNLAGLISLSKGKSNKKKRKKKQ